MQAYGTLKIYIDIDIITFFIILADGRPVTLFFVLSVSFTHVYE